MEREIDRRIGAASAVMRTLHGSVVVKRELSRKAKLSIYQSIYVPTLTYGHELWVVTERTRSRVQAKFKCYLYTGKSSAFGNSYILLSMCYVEIDCILILTLLLFFSVLF